MAPFRYSTRVCYGDIDENLNLSFSGTMRLMQEAAMIHSSHSGYSAADVERTRVVWMLVQWRVRLTGKVQWNEQVDVITWPRTMERINSKRCFRIVDRQNREIAVGESDWILVNADTGRIMRIPAEVASSYQLESEDVFDEPLSRLPNTTGEETFACAVMRRDLDTNRHVNNLVYLDYAMEALPTDLASAKYTEVVIHYHRQLLVRDQIHCYHSYIENGQLIKICGEDPKQLHCTVCFFE